MPYLYFFILLLFLFLYSLLITWQLYNFIKLTFVINKSQGEQGRPVNLTNFSELLNSLKALSSRKLWFESLLLLESQLSLSIKTKESYFNAVSLIYKKMNQNDLAELYSLHSLLEQKNCSARLNNPKKIKG